MKLTRPPITSFKTGTALKQWYWLREDLVVHCKITGINYAGGKFDILNRIANILDGKKSVGKKQDKKTIATFDWHSALLTPETKITDSYKIHKTYGVFLNSIAVLHFILAYPLWHG
jgi:SAP domain-containing new25